MKPTGKSDVARLLDYAGSYKWLTVLGLSLSGIAMLCSLVPYISIWLVAKSLIEVAPSWSSAGNIWEYGLFAIIFAVVGIAVYFAALMCTHLAAFRTAENIRKRGIAHLMDTPLGYFDTNASGLIRGRLDSAASDTETLLAHNLADIVGTIVLFISMMVLLFVFDWRMGGACALSAVVSVAAMAYMMGGRNAALMGEYQAAQDRMTKAGTEYVRGIPVVKIFQQTVYSFKAFKDAIDEYSDKAEYYQAKVCKVPQSINLTFTEGAFIFLVPVVLFLAPRALESGSFAEFVSDFAFYAVFSAIIATSLARIMFASSGALLASTALSRIDTVMNAPTMEETDYPKKADGNKVEFKDVSFTYSGSSVPALSHVSFAAESGEIVALVGPSGGGKSTAASLIPRFWDVQSGSVEVGGVDVRKMAYRDLMDHIAFVFQSNHLFKASILDNVRIARPSATRDDVLRALTAAQCLDIIEKLPAGMDTMYGSDGVYLSGGEMQRIALARAILKDAPIIVLDEATAFADPENEVLIQRALSALVKGRTVIMIAHRLSTVVGADMIIVLNEGKVVEQGSHEELLSKGGMYSRMWSEYNRSINWKISGEKEA